VCRNRRLKPATFQYAQLSESPLTGQIQLPALNEKGVPTNIYQVFENGEKRQDGSPKLEIRSSPYPCEQQLYGLETLRPKGVRGKPQHKIIYLCEGHWDRLAWLEVLSHLAYKEKPTGKNPDPEVSPKVKPDYEGDDNLRLTNHATVLGVPGSHTFKEKWLRRFKGKEVILLYDNDEPGRKGIKKVLSMFGESDYPPATIQVIRWQEGDPGDINDVVRKHQGKTGNTNYLKTYTFVQERLEVVDLEKEAEENYTPVYDAIDCPTFRELVKHYKGEHPDNRWSGLRWTKDIEKTLATMLATIISTTVEGAQLGLRVIGPPASLKSTLAECCSQNKRWVYPLSKFTGLVSGFSRVSKAQQTANKMNGKCVMVKEADTLIQMPNLSQIESEIRDVLGDGVIRAEYRNGIVVDINTVFTMILCGTKRLRQLDDAILGSRFVDVVIHKENTDTDSIVSHAINSQFDLITGSLSSQRDEDSKVGPKENISKLAPATLGFLDAKKAELIGGLKFDPMKEDQIETIHSAGELVSLCRAKVERDRSRNITQRPEREIPTRISEQLTRLALFLAVVLRPRSMKGNIRITKPTMEVIKKVVYDTCEGFRFEILQYLLQEREGMTKDQLARRLQLSITHVYYLLQDLEELKVVTKDSVTNVSGRRGRNAHFWKLKPEIADILRRAVK